MKSVYVITGAASTGKTTIINELRKRGILCQDELARPLITKLTEQKSSLVPWIDLNGFNNLLLDQYIKQHNTLTDQTQFLDRGIPDIIGYLSADNKPIHKKFYEATKKYRYNNNVFFTEPWQDIYHIDNERREPFSKNELISNSIKKSYIDAGYDVISVPKGTVKERVDFILNLIPKDCLTLNHLFQIQRT